MIYDPSPDSIKNLVEPAFAAEIANQVVELLPGDDSERIILEIIQQLYSGDLTLDELPDKNLIY